MILRIQPLPGGFKFRSVLLKLADALHVLVVLAIQPLLGIHQLAHLTGPQIDLFGSIAGTRSNRSVIFVRWQDSRCIRPPMHWKVHLPV